MSALRELYQEVILDHSRHPRNFRIPANADHSAEGFNPLCGDRVTVYVQMDGEVVKDLAFQGSGCAISTASASMLTESLKGKTRAQAEDLFNKFHQLVTGDPLNRPLPSDLGKLEVFSGVREFPMRVKCATLAWHTLNAALRDRGGMVSTE
jgi:nitrogen fixation NifU-like protein